MSSLFVEPGTSIRQETADSAQANSAFRGSDVLSTLNADGTRRWLCPKPSFGKFWQARRIVAYVLIAIFTLIPYLSVNGKPMVLLDLTTRRFTILGYTFLPTDTLIFALLFISIFVMIFLMTALFGRVWCGWACPQTVYMEFVYRPLDRLFDGTPGRVKKNAFQGSGLARVLKYATFFVISCYLAHTFLAYFVGVEALSQWVRQSPMEHPTPFMVMAVVTALMMFDFSFFREQTCLVACPYGRFQSVLLDRHSVIVSYDRARGEPRGKRRPAGAKGGNAGASGNGDVALAVLNTPAESVGDCVDCKLCVQTCPTGIDIRNGLQMECIHCTQCVDACDAVMTKLNRPTGLIRYSSQAALAGEKKTMVRPRVVLYPLLLVILLTGFALALWSKGPADVSILRERRGAAFIEAGPGLIGNLVRIKIVNRTDKPVTYQFHLEGMSADGQATPLTGAEVRAEDNPVTLAGGEMKTIPATVVVPFDRFTQGKLDVVVKVTDGAGFSKNLHLGMLGPGSLHHSDAGPSGVKEELPRSVDDVSPGPSSTPRGVHESGSATEGAR